MREIAASNDVTPSQIALSWITNRTSVVAPIIGARTRDQLEQNLVAGDLELSDHDSERLDQISSPTPNDYPYGPFGVKQRDRYIYSSDQAITELF